MSLISRSLYLFSNSRSILQLQARFAGHSKWQNIKSTKQANDNLKSKTISRYVTMVRRAVIDGGRQPDPKINTKLGEVMGQAFKMNVPKATLERAIERAIKIKIDEKLVEIQGPGGSAIICKCETENVSFLRREIKKIAKKFNSTPVAEGKLLNMFLEKGYVRANYMKKDGTEINPDIAEEAAIEAGAEEVQLEESCDNEDPTKTSKVWVFITEGNGLFPCKSRLETANFEILSASHEITPYRRVDFGEKVYGEVQDLIKALSEIGEVVDVYHNVLDSPIK